MPILTSSTTVADPYLAIVAAGLEPWLDRNRATVHRFADAYAKATHWVFDPAHREEAIGLLVKARPGISRETAERLYALETDPQVGNVVDGVIRQAEVKTVLDLRQTWNGFDTPQDTAKLSRPNSGIYRRP
jgi:ABC-type nitrate/sulfonate/bicarbonate transport system substrate-binding protein